MLPSKSIAVTDMLLVPIEAMHNTMPSRINHEMSTLLGKQAPRIPNKFFRKRLHGLAKIGARGHPIITTGQEKKREIRQGNRWEKRNDLEDEALVLLGLGGDLDGLLRQNRLRLVPLHAKKLE
jgi:hypothetical protein